MMFFLGWVSAYAATILTFWLIDPWDLWRTKDAIVVQKWWLGNPDRWLGLRDQLLAEQASEPEKEMKASD